MATMFLRMIFAFSLLNYATKNGAKSCVSGSIPGSSFRPFFQSDAFWQFIEKNNLRAKFPIRAKLLDDRKMELHFAFSHFFEKKNSGETWCNSGVIRCTVCKSGETSRTTVF